MSCFDLAATTHHEHKEQTPAQADGRIQLGFEVAAKAWLKQNEKNRNRIEMNERL